MAFTPPVGIELEQHIGTGSVFDVALVREAGVTLVCKRLTSRLLREPAGRAAMMREAKVLALAHHAALPSLVRVGSDGHGPFLLETRALGSSLRELAEGWAEGDRGVPGLLVRHLARASIEALAELQSLEHEGSPLDFVHGDIGPDHVLMGPLGQVRFVDFGAARFRGMDEALETGDRGTLPFVAPEIARGEARPGQAHDVYALAATLIHLVTGHLSTVRDEAALLLSIGEHGIAPAIVASAGVYTEVERNALAAAVSLDPAARPRSARVLFDAFTLVEHQPLGW